MTAMQAFAACADVTPEPVGYCHGSLMSASHLANHEVCTGTVDDQSTPDVDESQGATENIGFHIRVPFVVNLPGLYSFRYHMDMGLGSFMVLTPLNHSLYLLPLVLQCCDMRLIHRSRALTDQNSGQETHGGTSKPVAT